MFLLELDPNIVKPGWTPFLITLGLAAVMYLLFRSMRRQFRRVDANYADPALDEPGTPAGTGADGTGPAGKGAAANAATRSPVEGSPPH